MVSTGEFYFATFDTIQDGTRISAIPNLEVRFHGKIDSINSEDFTDMILKRDGEILENPITYKEKRTYEDCTDFYFSFAQTLIIDGIYTFTGKYKGEAFEVPPKIIESSLGDSPANPKDLESVGFGYYAKDDDPFKVKAIAEIMFQFNGRQEVFSQSNLSEFKLLRDDEEVEFSVLERVYRYYDYVGNRKRTIFNLVFTEQQTLPGKYYVSGKYQGKDFKSQEMNIR